MRALRTPTVVLWPAVVLWPVIAGTPVTIPTGLVAPVSWAIVSAIVIHATVIAGRAAIIPAVIDGLRPVTLSKVIEQKRERQRNTKTHPVGPGLVLGAQDKDWKQKNEELFHGRFSREPRESCHSLR